MAGLEVKLAAGVPWVLSRRREDAMSPGKISSNFAGKSVVTWDKRILPDFLAPHLSTWRATSRTASRPLSSLLPSCVMVDVGGGCSPAESECPALLSAMPGAPVPLGTSRFQHSPTVPGG